MPRTTHSSDFSKGRRMTEQNQESVQQVQLNAVCLPKWPQMFVWGKPVTPDEAKDIIFRTDSFLTDFDRYSGGNNHQWNTWAQSVLGYTKYVGSDEYSFLLRLQDKLRAFIGFVGTEYVHNTWASSSYIFGPYGWCHPSGFIGYADNVGKWPSADEVFEDWTCIAKAFPFLDLTVTLMSGEHSDEGTIPVISFRVKDGDATVLDTPVRPPADFNPGARDFELTVLSLGNNSREQGLNDAWIKDFGAITTGVLADLEEEVRKEMAEATA
jgi:hypothetical protein